VAPPSPEYSGDGGVKVAPVKYFKLFAAESPEWLESNGKNADIIINSCIWLARNIQSIPGWICSVSSNF